MTPQELATAWRKKYPKAYDSIDDDTLTKAIIKKHPQYGKQLASVQGGGVAPSPSPASPVTAGGPPTSTGASAPAPAPSARLRVNHRALMTAMEDPANPVHGFTGTHPNLPNMARGIAETAVGIPAQGSLMDVGRDAVEGVANVLKEPVSSATLLMDAHRADAEDTSAALGMPGGGEVIANNPMMMAVAGLIKAAGMAGGKMVAGAVDRNPEAGAEGLGNMLGIPLGLMPWGRGGLRMNKPTNLRSQPAHRTAAAARGEAAAGFNLRDMFKERFVKKREEQRGATVPVVESAPPRADIPLTNENIAERQAAVTPDAEQAIHARGSRRAALEKLKDPNIDPESKALLEERVAEADTFLEDKGGADLYAGFDPRKMLDATPDSKFLKAWSSKIGTREAAESGVDRALARADEMTQGSSPEVMDLAEGLAIKTGALPPTTVAFKSVAQLLDRMSDSIQGGKDPAMALQQALSEADSIFAQNETAHLNAGFDLRKLLGKGKKKTDAPADPSRRDFLKKAPTAAAGVTAGGGVPVAAAAESASQRGILVSDTMKAIRDMAHEADTYGIDDGDIINEAFSMLKERGLVEDQPGDAGDIVWRTLQSLHDSVDGSDAPAAIRSQVAERFNGLTRVFNSIEDRMDAQMKNARPWENQQIAQQLEVRNAEQAQKDKARGRDGETVAEMDARLKRERRLPSHKAMAGFDPRVFKVDKPIENLGTNKEIVAAIAQGKKPAGDIEGFARETRPMVAAAKRAGLLVEEAEVVTSEATRSGKPEPYYTYYIAKDQAAMDAVKAADNYDGYDADAARAYGKARGYSPESTERFIKEQKVPSRAERLQKNLDDLKRSHDEAFARIDAKRVAEMEADSEQRIQRGQEVARGERKFWQGKAPFSAEAGADLRKILGMGDDDQTPISVFSEKQMDRNRDITPASVYTASEAMNDAFFTDAIGHKPLTEAVKAIREAVASSNMGKFAVHSGRTAARAMDLAARILDSELPIDQKAVGLEYVLKGLDNEKRRRPVQSSNAGVGNPAKLLTTKQEKPKGGPRVPLTRSERTGGSPIFEKTLEGSVPGAGPFRRFRQRQQEALKSEGDRLVTGISRYKGNAEQLGKHVKGDLKAAEAADKLKFDKAYEALDNTGKGIKVDTKDLSAFAKSELATLKAQAKIIPPTEMARVTKFLTKAAKAPKSISFKVMHDARSTLLSIVRDMTKESKAKGTLKQMIGIIEDSMEKAAKNSKDPAFYSDYRKVSSEFKEHVKNFRNKLASGITGEKIHPENVHLKLQKASLDQVRRLKASTRPGTFKAVKARIVRDLLDKATDGELTSTGGIAGKLSVGPKTMVRLHGGKLKKALEGQYGKEKLEAIFDKGELQAMYDLADVAERADVNNSGNYLSAIVNASLGAGALYGTMNPPMLAKTGATYAAFNIAARIMTRKWGAQAMKNHIEAKPGTAAKAFWAARVQALITQARREEEEEPMGGAGGRE